MGWAYCGTMSAYVPDRGVIQREIGYGIEATCDMRGCDEVINRGLGCVCGEMHHGPFDDEPGCGRYFCGKHLYGLGPKGGCRHRFKGAYGQTMCQPMGNDAGKIWCACRFEHHVEWSA